VPGSRGISRTPRTGSFQSATTGTELKPLGRAAALRHTERSERQHGRARVICQNAGISCRPARVKLRSVEQGSEHHRRANRPDNLGNFIYLSEVFADERSQSNVVA
jgi:hypothetical protein